MRKFTAAAVAAAVLATPAAASAAACPDADNAPAALDPGERVAAVVCLLNAQRAARHLAPLAPDARLARSARRHSADMVAHHYVAHSSPSGASLRARIARTGFLRGRQGWRVAEVLAWGSGSYATPASTVVTLMSSPKHRRVLLGAFRYVGVGVALGVPFSDADGATYTLDLGS